jgi:hypothetical protein
MSEPIRLPLVEGLEPRLADSDKDGLSSNVYYDKQQDGKTFAVKRPGITSILAGLGQGAGLNGEFAFYLYKRVWTGAYGNGVFVVADYLNNGIWERTRINVSSDGINWQATLLLDADTVCRGVVFNGTYFFLIAVTLASAQRVFRSTDGLNWQEVTVVAALPLGFYEFSATSDGKLFAVKLFTTATMYYSTDGGVTWALATLPANSSFTSIVYSASIGRYVTSDATSTNVYYSSTGASWTAVSLGSLNFPAYISTNGTSYVTVSKDGTEYYRSTDGVTWSVGTIASTPSGSGTFLATTWTGSSFVAISQLSSPRILSSADGLSWSYLSFAVPITQIQYPWQLVSDNSIIVAPCFTKTDGAYLYYPIDLSEQILSNLIPIPTQDYRYTF